MQAVAEAPRIAKATVMHDGLLVEFRSGLVIFYRDAFFWEQQNYALARRAAVERQPWVARESAATEAEEQQP